MTKIIFLAGFGLWLNVFTVTRAMSQIAVNAGKKTGKAHFVIRIEDATDNDTLVAHFNDRIVHVSTARYSWKQSLLVRNKDGNFYFSIDSFDKPGYFSLSRKIETEKKMNLGFSIKSLFWNYFVEPGDDIRIEIRRDSLYSKFINHELATFINERYYGAIYINPEHSIYFSGLGSAKYRCRYEADRITSAHLKEDTSSFAVGRRCKVAERVSLDILKKYRKELSLLAYEVLKADFTGYFGDEWYYAFRYSYAMAIRNKDTGRVQLLNRALSRELSTRFPLPSPNAVDISANYATMLISREKTRNLVQQGDLRLNLYYSLKNNYKPPLLDRLITTYLIYEYKRVANLDTLLADALSIVKTAYCYDLLKQLQDAEATGSRAYNFSLPDTSGNLVSLNDLRGKVVFIDFWYKNCSNCVDYYVYHLSKVEEEFSNNKNVAFVTINVDPDKATWMKAIYDNKHTSLSAINLNTGEQGSGHDVIRHYKVVGYPRPLLIDKEGKIFSVSEELLRRKETLAVLIREALEKKPFGRIGTK